jgi:hypothetical protein
VREGIRPYLEETAGIGELVDFVEDQPGPGEGTVELLRVRELLLGGGKVAVDVVGIGDGPSEGGFSDAADTGEPDDGSEVPGREDSLEPERALDHQDSGYIQSDQM